jgi:hypothetical protein
VNNEIGRFGQQAGVTPRYYRIKQYHPTFRTWQVLLVRIDELGNEEFAGYGALAEGESIGNVMSLQDAKAEHMRPAVTEAEATERRWRESRPPPAEREPEREPMDKATERFFSDADTEIEYNELERRRWRG